MRERRVRGGVEQDGRGAEGADDDWVRGLGAFGGELRENMEDVGCEGEAGEGAKEGKEG